MLKGEVTEYHKRQYAEDAKTVQCILKCLDGLTLKDAYRVLGFVKQELPRRVKDTSPFGECPL